MDPKTLIAAVVLICLIVWMFIQDAWRSPSSALLIALAILVIVRLLGLWAW